MPPARSAALALLIAALALVAACASSGPPPPVRYYTLEYDAPPAGQPLPTRLRVGSFGAAPGADSRAMAYRPAANQRAEYPYNNWVAPPADLLAGFLARDLRAARATRALLGPEDPGEARFELSGGVEEFLENDGPTQWTAVVKVNLTLWDKNAAAAPARVVWQRSYAATQPMPSRSPLGLAQGMSQAVARLNAQAIADIRQALAKRLEASSQGQPPAAGDAVKQGDQD